MAIDACEKFCATEKQCWGCSVDCNKTCHFNAISQCGAREPWSGLIIGDTSQKPGTVKFMIRFDIIC